MLWSIKSLQTSRSQRPIAHPKLPHSPHSKPDQPLHRGYGLASCLAFLLLTASGCTIASPPSVSDSVSAPPAQAETLVAMSPERPAAASTAETIRVGSQAELTSEQSETLAAIASARVIYLGETHDQVADHQAQLQIIRNLVDQGKSVAISLEMFQRPFQPILDQYLAGDIDLEQLRIQSEYDERWGFPWELYSPILDYAKTEGLPLIAANTPREVTRKVARQGLDSLVGDELTWIPALEEINVKSQDYRTFVKHVFDSFHGHGGHGSSERKDSETAFNNFFAAQVLWDETMAEAVATYVQTNPDHTVVMLAGQGHVIYDYGIPSRVQRRLGTEVSQASVLLNPSEQFRNEGTGKIADYFWLSE